MNTRIKTNVTSSIVLIGTVAGTIWMPARTCWKDVKLSYSPHLGPFQDDFRYSDGSKPTARDFALKATNDGDFQSCDLTADSAIRVSRRHHTDTGFTDHVREFPVTLFPSMADCVSKLESWELDSDWEDDDDASA